MGHWQMPLAIFVSLLVATFLSKSQLLINQVAIGSILIATIMPPGTSAGPDRMIDALLGCFTGIVVMALLPHSPLAEGRREVSTVLRLASTVLEHVAIGLKMADSDVIREELERVRGSQAAINAMLEAAKSGQEESTVSPLLWASRHRVRSFVRILAPWITPSAIRESLLVVRRFWWKIMTPSLPSNSRSSKSLQTSQKALPVPATTQLWSQSLFDAYATLGVAAPLT